MKRAEDQTSCRHGCHLTCVDRSHPGAFRHPIHFLSFFASSLGSSGFPPSISSQARRRRRRLKPLSCVLSDCVCGLLSGWQVLTCFVCITADVGDPGQGQPRGAGPEGCRRMALRIRTALLSSGQCTAEKEQAVLNLWMFSSARHGMACRRTWGIAGGALPLPMCGRGRRSVTASFLTGLANATRAGRRGRSGKTFEIFCSSKELKRWPSSFPLERFTVTKKWDRQQPQPPNLGPGPRTQWHSDIFKVASCPPRDQSPFVQGRPTTSSRMTDCGAAVSFVYQAFLLSHSRERVHRGPWPWPVGWGVSHRPGGAAGDRHHTRTTFARDRPRTVELNSGARAPPGSFCISLRPGMRQGERAVQFLSPLSSSLVFSLFSSPLSPISGIFAARLPLHQTAHDSPASCASLLCFFLLQLGLSLPV